MSKWKPQAPEVYDEALTFLVADATRRHKEAHDAAPEGCCRRCLSRELRHLVAEAEAKLPPEEYKLLRGSVRGALG
jgi:hypothetical protein